MDCEAYQTLTILADILPGSKIHNEPANPQVSVDINIQKEGNSEEKNAYKGKKDDVTGSNALQKSSDDRELKMDGKISGQADESSQEKVEKEIYDVNHQQNPKNVSVASPTAHLVWDDKMTENSMSIKKPNKIEKSENVKTEDEYLANISTKSLPNEGTQNKTFADKEKPITMEQREDFANESMLKVEESIISVPVTNQDGPSKDVTNDSLTNQGSTNIDLSKRDILTREVLIIQESNDALLNKETQINTLSKKCLKDQEYSIESRQKDADSTPEATTSDLQHE